jgi:hypothetical protein
MLQQFYAESDCLVSTYEWDAPRREDYFLVCVVNPTGQEHQNTAEFACNGTVQPVTVPQLIALLRIWWPGTLYFVKETLLCLTLLTTFWVLAPCWQVGRYQRFGGKTLPIFRAEVMMVRSGAFGSEENTMKSIQLIWLLDPGKKSEIHAKF